MRLPSSGPNRRSARCAHHCFARSYGEEALELHGKQSAPRAGVAWRGNRRAGAERDFQKESKNFQKVTIGSSGLQTHSICSSAGVGWRVRTQHTAAAGIVGSKRDASLVSELGERRLFMVTSPSTDRRCAGPLTAKQQLLSSAESMARVALPCWRRSGREAQNGTVTRGVGVRKFRVNSADCGCCLLLSRSLPLQDTRCEAGSFGGTAFTPEAAQLLLPK